MAEERTTLVACSLGQDEHAARLRRWQALGARACLAVVETDDGLRLRFRAEPGVEAELAALVVLERECCPFAEWSVTAEAGRLTLRVSGGSDEAVAAVHGMFHGLRSPA